MGRKKIIEDDELLAVARGVFVENGIGVSTREVARSAGISEAAIYQRYPTKEDLFFASMVLPPLDVETVLADGPPDADVCGHLEIIALRMLDYFREIMPILVLLMTHSSFDFEEFSRRNPNSPLAGLRTGLVEYLQSQQEAGNVSLGNIGPAVLNLVSAVHSLALFERLGVHGGTFAEGDVRGMVRSLWWGLAPRV